MWFCLLISKRSRFLNWLPVIGNDICLKMSQGAPFFNGMPRRHGSAARHRDWEHLWFLTACASEYRVEWPIPTDVMEIMATFILHWKWCWDFWGSKFSSRPCQRSTVWFYFVPAGFLLPDLLLYNGNNDIGPSKRNPSTSLPKKQ